MSESLFKNLKDIGIDEELAHQVSASLNPDHIANKQDILVLQEAILQQQVRSDKRYHEQRAESDKRYFELKSEMIQGFADVRSEMHAMNRQFIFAYGGMIVTILSVLAINIYYH